MGTDRGLAKVTASGFKLIAGTAGRTIRSIVADSDGTLYLADLPATDVMIYRPADGNLRHVDIGSRILPQ